MHSEEPNLFQHLSEIRAKLYSESSASGLSNIIFAGKLRTEADISEGLHLHRKIVEEEVNNSEANITGILMGQGNSLLHFLEGPCRSILNIISKLNSHQQFIDGVQVGRIIYSVEDRPDRVYPEWYSCVIQERKSQIESLDTESCKDVVHNLATGLFEVGKGIKNEQRDDVELSRYADNLPGKNLIILLASSNDFFTIEEFVDLYAGSFHIDMESEKTWPIEKLVEY